jgi:hypothetical protein
VFLVLLFSLAGSMLCFAGNVAKRERVTWQNVFLSDGSRVCLDCQKLHINMHSSVV